MNNRVIDTEKGLDIHTNNIEGTPDGRVIFYKEDGQEDSAGGNGYYLLLLPWAGVDQRPSQGTSLEN